MSLAPTGTDQCADYARDQPDAMKFTVPDSSDIPSTPNRSDRRDPIPSTTPQGPPPSASKSIFGPNGQRAHSNAAASSDGNNAFKPSTQQQRGRTYGYIPSSPPHDGPDDTAMTEDNHDSLLGISPGVQDSAMLRSSFLTGALLGAAQESPARSPKRQRISHDHSIAREPGPVDVKSYARGIVASSGALKLGGSDALILATEGILENLVFDVAEGTSEEQLASLTARELLQSWSKLYPIDADDVVSEDIGPSAGQPTAISASMLAHFLLPLHHPSASETSPTSKSRSEQSVVPHGSKTHIPKFLIQWLSAFHEPGADVVDSVKASKGCYANDAAFWDAIMSSVIRGQLSTVVEFLRGANFRKTSEKIYTNPQLDYIDEAIELMLEILQSCPALQSDDWDVKGAAWSLFRRQLVKAQEELRDMLEGDDGGLENINRSQLSFSLSQKSQAAESRLPKDVYDSLNDICEMLLGDPYAVKNAAFDWLEAVVCLTIWWDGEDASSNSRHSLGASSRTLKRSTQSRQADLTPTLAYRQRLSDAFRLVVDEEDLAAMIDWNSPMHVALCCIMESELQSVLNIMKIFSLTIASAIADIGSTAGWLAARPTDDLDEQDLMVLSYAQQPDTPDVRDDLLQTYAKLLSARQVVEDKAAHPPIRMEAWDLSLGILSRMNNSAAASEQATKLVKNILLSSNGQVDSLLEACAQYGFSKQVDVVAVKYADQLAETTHNYGDSLFYYSKGHDAAKLKGLLHSLIALSVIQSAAFPPRSDLDERLSTLLKSPFKAVKELGDADFESARDLSTYLSGYATVRKFYETRDSIVISDESASRKNDELRKKAAISLLAAISSSSDSIRGGVLDSEVDDVIPVDHLLVLLGEALAFINRSTQVLAFSQMITMLKVLEDLDTVDAEVFKRCEVVFETAIANAHDASNSSYESLKKSISNLTTTSSQFSLISNSMLNSQVLEASGAITASTEGEDMAQSLIQRAWDWRKGFRPGSTPRDVIKILRLGLARELAKSWLDNDGL